MAGWFADGSIAMVDHAYGKGSTRLVGSMPGYGYKRQMDMVTRGWFKDLMSRVGKQPHIQVEDGEKFVIRLWRGSKDWFIWAVNQNDFQAQATAVIDAGTLVAETVHAIRGKEMDGQLTGNHLQLSIPGRDVLVLCVRAAPHE